MNPCGQGGPCRRLTFLQCSGRERLSSRQDRLVGQCLRRRIYTEEKAKVICASDVFGPFPPKSPGLEGHSSWREEAADKEAKRGSTNEEGAWWTGLILPQVMGETRDRGQCPCMPSQLISPPPSSPTFPPPPFYPPSAPPAE